MSKAADAMYQINMTVLNDNDFLSPYSPTDSPVISSDVADFLENSAENYLPKHKITLNIHSDCIDEQEQVAYDKAIRSYFSLKLQACKRDLKRNLIVSIIFTVIGIIGLAVMFLLDRFDVNGIWVEVIDIFAWVFVWEAVDQFFIERHKIARDARKYRAFTEATINYRSTVLGK